MFSLILHASQNPVFNQKINMVGLRMSIESGELKIEFWNYEGF
jgi:hypothetical protein